MTSVSKLVGLAVVIGMGVAVAAACGGHGRGDDSRAAAALSPSPSQSTMDTLAPSATDLSTPTPALSTTARAPDRTQASQPGSAPGGAAAAAPGQAGEGGSTAPRCTTAGLAAQFTLRGTGRASVGLRNTTAAKCAITGYPGLQLLDAHQQPVSTYQVKSDAAHSVLLAPGAVAWSSVSWTVTAAADEPRSGPCQPAAALLVVIPPEDRGQLTVPFSGGSVCDHGRLSVSALGLGAPTGS